MKDRIPKLIIKPSEIEGDLWNLNLEESMHICRDCGGMIFFVKKIFGVVAEEMDYGILGWRSKRNYKITEIGLNLYCAECGEHMETYSSFCYEKENIVCDYDDINGEGINEIEFCLRQFNEKGKFIPLFKTGESKALKEKLEEYEKKNPIEEKKKEDKKKK